MTYKQPSDGIVMRVLWPDYCDNCLNAGPRTYTVMPEDVFQGTCHASLHEVYAMARTEDTSVELFEESYDLLSQVEKEVDETTG